MAVASAYDQAVVTKRRPVSAKTTRREPEGRGGDDAEGVVDRRADVAVGGAEQRGHAQHLRAGSVLLCACGVPAQSDPGAGRLRRAVISGCGQHRYDDQQDAGDKLDRQGPHPAVRCPSPRAGHPSTMKIDGEDLFRLLRISKNGRHRGAGLESECTTRPSAGTSSQKPRAPLSQQRSDGGLANLPVAWVRPSRCRSASWDADQSAPERRAGTPRRGGRRPLDAGPSPVLLCRPSYLIRNGMTSRATMLMTLIIGLIAGPAVSL